MSKKRDYVVEAQRQADEIASRSSGITRSEAQRKAESEAYDRLKRAQESARRSGAGRGTAPASSYKRKSGRD